MTRAPLYLMQGHTAHVRSDHIAHKFRYGVTLIDIDVDQLDDANAASKYFSIDKPNLVSFKTNKVGPLGQQSLSEWARNSFSSHDIETENCSIRLLTFPRTELYSFSPLSVWRLIDQNEQLKALIYEVHNTFGEQHCYIVDLTKDGPRHMTEKAFHVSPFFGVEGDYQFTVAEANERFQLSIQNIVDGKRTHTATLDLNQKPITNQNLFRFVLTSPFAGFGVMIAIHWQALKLFMKNAKYHSKPPVPKQLFTQTATSNRIRSKGKTST